MISYDPLWETMKRKGVSQYALLKNGLDPKTLDSIKKEKGITTHTIEILCNILDCTPNDLITFKKQP